MKLLLVLSLLAACTPPAAPQHQCQTHGDTVQLAPGCADTVTVAIP